MPSIAALRRSLPPLPPAERIWREPEAYPCTDPGPGSCGECTNCQFRPSAEEETENRRYATQRHQEALEALQRAIADSRPIVVPLETGRIITAGRPHEDGDTQPEGGDVYTVHTAGWTVAEHRAGMRKLAEARLAGATVQVIVSGTERILKLYRPYYTLERLSPLGRGLWLAVGGPTALPKLESVETPDCTSYL